MLSLNGRLLVLVQALDTLGPGPSLAALAQTFKAAKLTPADVADFVHANSRGYNRAPVVVRESYELLVMTWLPGQASVPHDHSGAICVMQVVQGEAVEGCYRVAPDGYVDLQYETTVSCGEIMAGQDAGVHTIQNVSKTNQLLVTVHVYAPPLKDFRQFTPRPKSASAELRSNGQRRPTVVIVGGGFSGAMAAAQTLHRAAQAGLPVQVILVERRGAVGEGLAYSTREPSHLLNVPAGRMSAWPDRPEDFLRWASRRLGTVQPGDFLPRQWYGEYVRETLLATAKKAAGSAELVVVFDEVRRVSRHPQGGWMVHLAREASLHADAVVLAVGHRPPGEPIGLQWSGPRTRYLANPWLPFALNVVRPDEPVCILGSGLTAVDTVMALTQQPRQAPITLVSRNGLLPHSHAASTCALADLHAFVAELVGAPGGVRARTLLRRLRNKTREFADLGIDWRSLVDGLRPFTAQIWRSLPLKHRRQFLMRLRPFWEVHRHRMAPGVAEQLQRLLDCSTVRLVAGRLVACRATVETVALTVRRRGRDESVETVASWVINCTGPVPSNSVESNPVIGSLLVYGWLRPDELGLGIETSLEGNAIAADCRAIPDLFVIGTLRKPAFWESTAVPELRSQAAAIAEGLLLLLKPRFTHQSLRSASY
jgi:uncharacterized NAD(P)/FAD-binding protein YdhS